MVQLQNPIRHLQVAFLIFLTNRDSLMLIISISCPVVMPTIPILPSINTCMSLTTTTTTTTIGANTMKVPEVNTTQLQALAEVCSNITGAEQIANMTHHVMNSLVSPTKVVTNDSLPNPIVSASISLPAFPIPVSSIGIPMLDMKGEHEDEDIVVEADRKLIDDQIEIEEDKLSEMKKVEPMPVEDYEDDGVLQMAAQIEENITETDGDVNVGDGDDSQALNKNTIDERGICKNGKLIVANGTGPEIMAVGETNFSSINTTEPMECVPTTNVMASPKHIMVNDVNMFENVSVNISHLTIFTF